MGVAEVGRLWEWESWNRTFRMRSLSSVRDSSVAENVHISRDTGHALRLRPGGRKCC